MSEPNGFDDWVAQQWSPGSNQPRPPWLDDPAFTRQLYGQMYAAQAQQWAKSLEAQAIDQLRRDNAELRQSNAQLIKRVTAIEAVLDKLVLKKGVVDNCLSRIEQLEKRPAGMHYKGVWSANTGYPGNALVTEAGAAWIATQPTSPGEKPGDGGSWKMILKSDLANLQRAVRDELQRKGTVSR